MKKVENALIFLFAIVQSGEFYEKTQVQIITIIVYANLQSGHRLRPQILIFVSTKCKRF